MNRQRRMLLQGLAAAATLPVLHEARASEARMLHRAIPSSGEQIPVVGLGTWLVFKRSEMEIARGVLARFAQLGGKLVDTSPMYGEAEDMLGELAAQAGVREKLFLATKVWTRGRRDGEQQIAQSFELLRRPQLDLLQIHNLLDWEAHVPTLRQLKEQKRVRYLGITHYTDGMHAGLVKVMRTGTFDFVQANYNIANRAAEAQLLPAAAELGVAVIVNRPFEEGALFGRVRGKPLPEWAARELACATWGQYLLKFILSHPAVTAVIPATAKLRHLEDNLGAARGPLPDMSQRERMAAEFARL